MADINVIHTDEANLKIEADEYKLKEVYKFFSYRDPDFEMKCRRKPQLRYSSDGFFHLFDKRGNKLPFGLINTLLEFVSENNYTIDIPSTITNQIDNYSDIEINNLINDMNFPFPLYEYQVDAIKQAINKHRVLLVSPTGSGKCTRELDIEIEVTDEDYNKYFSDIPICSEYK